MLHLFTAARARYVVCPSHSSRFFSSIPLCVCLFGRILCNRNGTQKQHIRWLVRLVHHLKLTEKRARNPSIRSDKAMYCGRFELALVALLSFLLQIEAKFRLILRALNYYLFMSHQFGCLGNQPTKFRNSCCYLIVNQYKHTKHVAVRR